jgi:large subunit ribosomal protein L29
MKAKDLRERSLDDLQDLEKTLAKDVFQVRFKNFTNRLDDTSAIRKTKKDLARVKTLLREQSIVAATKGEAPKAEAKAAAPAKKKAASKAPAKKTAKKEEAK